MIKRIVIALLIVLQGLVWNSCGIYSFSGAAIPAEAKTVKIPFFNNQASLVQPTLSQVFTDKLRERFLNQTNLSLTTGDGDLTLEGEVVDYKIKPAAIQSNDQGALNQLSISIKVRFNNRFDAKANFEQVFTRIGTYPPERSLSEVESVLIAQISDLLVDDIFNRSVANW